MMYSRLRYPYPSTLLIVASMYWPWLKDGVTTDIFGHPKLLPFIAKTPLQSTILVYTGRVPSNRPVCLLVERLA